MTKVEELIEQAKALPPESLVTLYDALHDLISPPDPAWEAAWAEEAERRLAQLQRGEVEAEDFDVVMERLRQKFHFQ